MCTYVVHHELSVQASGGRSIWARYCKDYLPPCLETHKPLDLAIILLDTNDLKMRFSVSAYDIANGAGVLIQIVKKSETGPGVARCRRSSSHSFSEDLYRLEPANMSLLRLQVTRRITACI